MGIQGNQHNIVFSPKEFLIGRMSHANYGTWNGFLDGFKLSKEAIYNSNFENLINQIDNQNINNYMNFIQNQLFYTYLIFLEHNLSTYY